MKRKIITILSLVLVLTIVFSSISMTVLAENETVATEQTTETTAAPVAEAPVTTETPAEGEAAAPVVVAPAVDTYVPEVLTAGQTPKDMEKITENDKFILFANMKTGYFMMEDKTTGGRFYSNPSNAETDNSAQGAIKNEILSQIVVKAAIVDGTSQTNKNRYSNLFALKKNQVTVSKIDNGIKVVFKSTDKGSYEIPVTYVLDAKGLTVTILTEEIVESEDPTDEKIFSISLLPFMGAVRGADKAGYMFLPDGTGSLMNFKKTNKNYSPYRVKVGGLDSSYSRDFYMNYHEDISLPVIGIQDDKSGLLAFATQGAANATVCAFFAGQGSLNNRNYFEFEVRSIDTFIIGDRGDGWNSRDTIIYQTSPINVPNISVRYVPVGAIDSPDGGYNGMAKAYRDYFISDLGLKQQIPEQAPLYLTLTGSVRVTRSILGIPIVVTEKYTTFKRMNEIVNELNENNIGKLMLTVNGWSEDGIRGVINDRFDAVGAIGGKKELNKLSSAVKDFDGNLFLQTNSIFYKKSGNGVSSKWDSARNINSVAADILYYRRNVFLYDKAKPITRAIRPQLFDKYFTKFVDDVVKRSNNIGISLNSITNSLQTDFGTKKKPGISRSEAVINRVETVKSVADKLPLLGDYSYAPFMANVVGSVNTPLTSSNFDCVDASVPFYQMVFHGYVPMGTKPMNEYANHTEMFLKAVESGTYLNYNLIGSDSAKIKDTPYNDLFSTNYDYWKPRIIAEQKRMQEVHNKVGKATITEHSQVEKGVYATTYDNGIIILVNYNENDVTYSGNTVKALDFTIVEGGIS